MDFYFAVRLGLCLAFDLIFLKNIILLVQIDCKSKKPLINQVNDCKIIVLLGKLSFIHGNKLYREVVFIEDLPFFINFGLILILDILNSRFVGAEFAFTDILLIDYE